MLTGHANYLSARRNLGSIGVDRETNHEHTRHSGYGATVFVASATCSPPTDSGSRVLFAETKPVDRTSIVSGFDANISDTDVDVVSQDATRRSTLSSIDRAECWDRR